MKTISRLVSAMPEDIQLARDTLLQRARNFRTAAHTNKEKRQRIVNNKVDNVVEISGTPVPEVIESAWVKNAVKLEAIANQLL